MGYVSWCICRVGVEQGRLYAKHRFGFVPETTSRLWRNGQPGKPATVPVLKHRWSLFAACVFRNTRQWTMDCAVRPYDQCQSGSEMGNQKRSERRCGLCLIKKRLAYGIA